MESSKNKRPTRLTFETIVILIIIILMIFLINFTQYKISEVVTADREALLIEHDPTDPLHDELAESILDFRPDACKMIEVYSADFQPIFRVQFKEDDNHMNDSISNHQELKELLENNEDGHTEVNIGDDVEDVYFRWETTAQGEKCLFIIYMSRPVVKHIWVVSATCYAILGLVFVLLLRLRMRNRQLQVEYYNRITQMMMNR